MEFEVEANITFTAMISVDANNEVEAKKLAESDLLSYYHLDVHGAAHNPDEIKIDMRAYNVEDE